MEFVELHRYFVPIGTDKEPIPDTEWLWGYRIAGWLTWPTLLKYRRVVLLAEALSGKTEEFRHQAAKLFAEGKPAFFMRIEELADGPFDDALDPAAVETFEAWDKGNDAGWFFLDSVDEARLNRKNFESALKRFRRKLDRSLERARVFISCRASDWKVRDDRISIGQLLRFGKPLRHSRRNLMRTVRYWLPFLSQNKQRQATLHHWNPSAKQTIS